MGLSACSNEVLMMALVLLLFLSSTVSGDCPTPILPRHSSLRGGGTLQDSYPTGTILQLTCITGYEPIPGVSALGMPPSIACLPSGEWAIPPTVCRGRRCPTPNVENGRMVSSNDLRLGDSVTFACDHGFRMIGGSTLKCVIRSGKVDWNKEPPHCQRIPCVRPPTIPNGFYDPDPTDEYTIGSAVVYRCAADYSLIGNSIITCIVSADGVNGEWNSPSPECKKVSCNRPNIQNGRVVSVFQPTYTYNADISLECNPGYTMVGVSFVRCDANSKWNPPVPSCVKTVVPTTTKPAGLPPSVRPVPPSVRPVPPVVPPIFPIPPTAVPPEEDEIEDIPVSPTQSETIPTGESGSGKTVVIAIGVILAALVLSAITFAAVKLLLWRRNANPPDTHRVASDRERALKEKKSKDELSPQKFRSKTQQLSTSQPKRGLGKDLSPKL